MHLFNCISCSCSKADKDFNTQSYQFCHLIISIKNQILPYNMTNIFKCQVFLCSWSLLLPKIATITCCALCQQSVECIKQLHGGIMASRFTPSAQTPLGITNNRQFRMHLLVSKNHAPMPSIQVAEVFMTSFLSRITQFGLRATSND